jgi:hypothetical protein
MDLAKVLKEKRPTLGSNSVKTYVSVLRSLHAKVFGTETPLSIDNFKQTEKIFDALSDKTPVSRKTTLSALVVLTNNDIYRQKMLLDIKAHIKNIEKQEKSQKQIENSISQDEIKQLLKNLKKKADVLFKQSSHSNKDYQTIQDYLMLLLMSGQGGFPPRRSLDYTAFRIKKSTDEDNFMEGKHFVFNTFKTAKSAGQQRIEVPLKTRNLIKKWIAINPTDLLFFDSHQNPMTSVKMTQKLNKIFDGKQISVNALRSSYLSTKFQDSIQLKKDIDSTMKQMGSSGKVATTYIKEEPSSP